MRHQRHWVITQFLLIALMRGQAQSSVLWSPTNSSIYVPPSPSSKVGASASATVDPKDIIQVPTTTSRLGTGNVTSSTTVKTTARFSAPTDLTGAVASSPPPGPFRGFKNGVYFTNWGIKASNYYPQELPISEITHVFYAFADIAANGNVLSSDPVVDLQTLYPRDSRQGTDHSFRDAYGVVKQLFVHKKKNRNLKTLLSIGGWNFSPKFASATASEMSRQTFAMSALKLVTDWGLDGIDVDWEYPATDIEGQNFVKLLAACRQAFDKYSFRNRLRYRFIISVASSASSHNRRYMDLANMNRYVDIWNLMAYDYAGSWITTTGHQANVFANNANTSATKLSTDDAINIYEMQGIHSRKILLGLPLYGRSFEGTSGLGQNYTNVGKGGTQQGVWSYQDLPKPGAHVKYDDIAKATYSYDPKARELISYDDVRSATFKARYLQGRQLGGAFFWEASGDKVGSQSLINIVSKNMRWLDETRNNLHYPTSQYRNIRLGMPGV